MGILTKQEHIKLELIKAMIAAGQISVVIKNAKPEFSDLITYIKDTPKKRTTKTTKSSFDFEPIYEKYPRKSGKKRGLEICQQQIKTLDQFNDLDKAVNNFAKLNENEDIKFIKHFSTFMGSYQDYIEVAESEFKAVEIKVTIDKTKLFGIFQLGVQRIADIPEKFALSDMEDDFVRNNGGLNTLSKMSEFDINRLLK